MSRTNLPLMLTGDDFQIIKDFLASIPTAGSAAPREALYRLAEKFNIELGAFLALPSRAFVLESGSGVNFIAHQADTDAATPKTHSVNCLADAITHFLKGHRDPIEAHRFLYELLDLVSVSHFFKNTANCLTFVAVDTKESILQFATLDMYLYKRLLELPQPLDGETVWLFESTSTTLGKTAARIDGAPWRAIPTPRISTPLRAIQHPEMSRLLLQFMRALLDGSNRSILAYWEQLPTYSSLNEDPLTCFTTLIMQTIGAIANSAPDDSDASIQAVLQCVDDFLMGLLEIDTRFILGQPKTRDFFQLAQDMKLYLCKRVTERDGAIKWHLICPRLLAVCQTLPCSVNADFMRHSQERAAQATVSAITSTLSWLASPLSVFTSSPSQPPARTPRDSDAATDTDDSDAAVAANEGDSTIDKRDQPSPLRHRSGYDAKMT